MVHSKHQDAKQLVTHVADERCERFGGKAYRTHVTWELDPDYKCLLNLIRISRRKIYGSTSETVAPNIASATT